MTIYRIHHNGHYLTHLMGRPDIHDSVDMHGMLHNYASPIAYGSEWEPLKLHFVDKWNYGANEIPDLSFDLGRLFLNMRAYNMLKNLLANQGEFLPLTYRDTTGYFFNVLKLAEHMDALIVAKSRPIIDSLSRPHYDSFENLAFDESKLTKTPLFKAEIDSWNGLFCTSKFIDIVTDKKLTGLYFDSDISNAIGGVYPINQSTVN